MASSVTELQRLLDSLQEGLKKDGLVVNLAKSFTVVFTKDRRRKKMIYDDKSSIRCNNVELKKFQVDDVFKYLGADFTPSGLYKTNLTELQTKIDVLLRTPTKPQQKLFMLKNFLLPTFYHKLIFSKQ